MKKEKIILFDLDGTLIDSTDAIVSTFYHTFKELEFDFDGCDKDIKDLITDWHHTDPPKPPNSRANPSLV